MRVAVDWSRECPRAPRLFNVGAAVVAHGELLAYGYSRDSDPTVHAEESALLKLRGADLADAVMYTSMEPCSIRKSRPLTCTQLILDSGIRRVFYAVREPKFLVDCEGVELLEADGLRVIEMPEFAAEVHAINSHISWE